MNIPTEDLLHYIWKTKNFDQLKLTTASGHSLEIIQFGHYNDTDGPDFLQAQVLIDGVKWVGSIEIHVKSSDWFMHGHSSDSNYENTILHVVYENDREVPRNDDISTILCLELKHRISSSILEVYNQFDQSTWIPCEPQINNASELAKSLAKERALSERLERKWREVAENNSASNNNWEETAYQLLCRSFGLVHNAHSFLEISKKVPFSVVKKNADNTLKLEALFYGVAGVLDEPFIDDYGNRLQKEFQFLKKKYAIEACHISLNHKAVRPHNFPEIALSQFISLIRQPSIFSKLMESDLSQLYRLLKVSASEYWDDHFSFDKATSFKKKSVGKAKMTIIIINALVPFFNFLSKKLSNERWAKKAHILLEELPSERNGIISKWKERGMVADSAYDSQALLELKKNFCEPKRCLSCPIGHHLLKGH